jgi:hypothetical protein
VNLLRWSVSEGNSSYLRPWKLTAKRWHVATHSPMFYWTKDSFVSFFCFKPGNA